jgi:hypothetical protein
MRSTIFFLFAFFSFCVWSQQDLSRAEGAGWTLRWELPVTTEFTWDADQAGNVYLFDEFSVSKLDTAGKKLLTQSTKSIGTIAKIDASNWLKIAIFSEEQQQICYLDNALAIQPGCIDLTALGVNVAQQFSTSAQTDRIWVYDQLNSELQLITIRTNQRQIVQNLKSLIDIGNVVQLTEFQNTLYLLDDRGQITTFDNFGTFIGSMSISSTWVQPFNTGVLTAFGSTINFTDSDGEITQPFFELPGETADIRRFVLVGKHLYLSTKDAFYCFQLV